MQRVFYGWWIVAVLFVALATTSGLGFYNASVILDEATDELGVSVTLASGATAVFFGVSGIVSFLTAKLLDRVDVRRFYLAGGLLGALSLYGLQWVDNGFELYVFFALFGTAFSTAGLAPSTTVIARWFDKRRPVALSVMSTGLSVGGIAITPFVARALDDRSLADIGPWLALFWLIGVIPLTALVVRSWPGDKGLLPDGATDHSAPPVVGAAAPGATFDQARASRFFRLLCAVYALIYLAQVGGLAHLFSLAEERTSTDTAATVLSVLALASVTGRLLGGAVVNRVSSHAMTMSLTLVQAGSLVLVGFAESTTTLVISAAIFGLSVGNLLMLQPLLLAETYGVREYSRIYSYNQLFGTLGVAGGPFVIGALRDVFDYRTAFVLAAIGNVIGYVLLRMAGPTGAARAAWEKTTG